MLVVFTMVTLSHELSCVFISQKINEKPQVIMDYESGKAIPNNQVLSKLERTLGEFII